jgi:predicted enzyme related to lactoylglutathione lyase
MTRTTENWPHGAPAWLHVSTPDDDATRDFYSQLLGWEISPGVPEFHGYAMASFDGSLVAGVSPSGDDNLAAWTLFFSTTDADETAGLIERSGGKLLSPVLEIGDAGRMVVAADPSGAMFGAWEANQLNGIGLHGQTGALSWNDLRSADPDRAREFYAAVFGYHYAPVEMAGPDYTTFSLTADGLPIGGIGGMMGMDGYPSHWIVYLAVPDVDEAVSRTPELGGHVVSPGFDTPYGRMAALADPTGASFWVLTMTEQG